MKRLALILSLVCVATAQTSVVDPRGARPVVHGTRDEKCATQKEWPFCSDDDWNSKCPSGCRIQGVMEKNDHDLLKKIEKIRSLLDLNKAKQRSTDQVSRQTYDYLREKLTIDSGNDNTYYDLAQNLRQRITDMKIRIDRQVKVLSALKDRVKNQVVEMQRLETDIDIKLRSCKGSCSVHTEYQVDKESYVALDKQINQLEAHSAQNIESVGTLYVMKSRRLKDAVVDSVFKSKDVGAQQKEDLFPLVNTVQLVLEEEGSSSSPATISKVPVCLKFKQQEQDGRQSPDDVFRNHECSLKSHTLFCSDDDWVSKCPSGCRLQGLISLMDTDVERKLQTVCKNVKMYEDTIEKSMLTMMQVYNSHRRAIVNRYMSEQKFVARADVLTRNFTSLRKRSDVLAQELKDLSSHVRKQIEELYRTEVDLDMKLRTCQGSCRLVLPFSVDHGGHELLQTDLNLMDKTIRQKNKAAAPHANTPQINLESVDVGLVLSTAYRTIPTARRELLTQFEDIGVNRFVLELIESTETGVSSLPDQKTTSERL